MQTDGEYGISVARKAPQGDFADRDNMVGQVVEQFTQIACLLNAARGSDTVSLLDRKGLPCYVIDILEDLIYGLDIDEPEFIEDIASWLEFKAGRIRQEFKTQ